MTSAIRHFANNLFDGELPISIEDLNTIAIERSLLFLVDRNRLAPALYENIRLKLLQEVPKRNFTEQDFDWIQTAFKTNREIIVQKLCMIPDITPLQIQQWIAKRKLRVIDYQSFFPLINIVIESCYSQWLEEKKRNNTPAISTNKNLISFQITLYGSDLIRQKTREIVERELQTHHLQLARVAPTSRYELYPTHEPILKAPIDLMWGTSEEDYAAAITSQLLPDCPLPPTKTVILHHAKKFLKLVILGEIS